MPDQGIFFAEIKEPLEIRRLVLESSKSVVSALKKYEEFKSNREEKLQKMMELNKLMKEIELLNNKLKKELPKTGLRAKPKEEKKKPKKHKKAEKKAKQEPEPQPKPRPKEMTDLEKLESELNEIESKLGNI